MLQPSALIGMTTEAEVLAAALNLGISVSLPFGGSDRYDQIWEINGKLLKIQIKTCSFDGWKIECAGKKSSSRQYTENEIDGIVTIHKGNLYYIPFNHCPSSRIRLWINQDPSKQYCGDFKWATDFRVENLIKE